MATLNEQRYEEFKKHLQGQVDNALRNGYDLSSMEFSIKADDSKGRPLSVSLELDWSGMKTTASETVVTVSQNSQPRRDAWQIFENQPTTIELYKLGYNAEQELEFSGVAIQKNGTQRRSRASSRRFTDG